MKNNKKQELYIVLTLFLHFK